jgi:protein-tyrosine phosphatase
MIARGLHATVAAACKRSLTSDEVTIEETDPAVSRAIELQHVFNLRDLGGYPTTDGRRVRWRTAFRGAGLQRLAGDDLETVRGLGWLHAVDLRTDAEVAASGLCPERAVLGGVRHLPLIARVWDPELLDTDIPAEVFLFERYTDMLREGAPVIREIVALLCDPANLPGVFYCAAGKDRTGVVAAVLLDTLGIAHETIAADYHRSKAEVDRIRDRASARAESGTMVVQPERWMQAPAGAMRLVLTWLRVTCGGGAGYLQAIGVPAGQVPALREALLEPA